MVYSTYKCLGHILSFTMSTGKRHDLGLTFKAAMEFRLCIGTEIEVE